MDKRLLDKEWRMSHLYKIQNKDEELVTFKRNRAQQHFNENKHTRNIILKSRQLGITTDESMDTLDDVLFTRNKNALFIAHTDKDAKKIFNGKIDFAWRNIDEQLRNLWKVDANNANELRFDFGDGTVSAIAVSTSGRSGTYGRVHVTELAKMSKKFPEKAHEVISGTIPSVPMNGRIDIESTAEGDYGAFYDMFWEAWDRGEPELPIQFKAHFYNWTWDDDEIEKVTEPIPFDDMDLGERFKEYADTHQLSSQQITYYYYKWLSLNKDWSLLRQEYPTTPEEAFVSSGNKFFDMDILSLYSDQVEEGEVHGDWTVYRPYDSRYVYAIGADVAEGVEGDSSTVVVWGFNTSIAEQKPHIAAVFASNKIPPDQFAFELRDIGNSYGTAIIGVERNNHGHTTLAKLKEIYPARFIYKEEKFDERKDKRTKKLGWHTNKATKPMMFYDFKTAFEQELITIPSKALLSEIRKYSQDDLNDNAQITGETRHWDILTAAVIGWQMRNHLKIEKEAVSKPTNKRRKRGYGRIV